MANMKFKKMEYSSADEMVLGESKYRCRMVWPKGRFRRVIPDRLRPRPGSEKTVRAHREYIDYITKDVLDRAVTLGFSPCNGNEWISQMG